MNIKTSIAAINKHLSDVFDLFGGQSEEYSRAINEVRQNIPDAVLQQTATQGLDYNADKPLSPLKLSQGQAAQNIYSNFQQDVANLRSEQKKTGSALMQAQKYIKELKALGKPFSKQNIRELAQDLYNFRNNVNDWYVDLTESDYLTDDEKMEVKNLYSQLSTSKDDPVLYEDIRRQIEHYYMIHTERKRQAESAMSDQITPDTTPFETDPMSLI